MNEFGKRVREMLEVRGMTQSELARLVGTKQQTINYIVHSDAPARSSKYATRIAEALGVNPVWLQTGKGDRNSPVVPVGIPGVFVGSTEICVLAFTDLLSRARGADHQNRGMLMTDAALQGPAFALEIEGDSMAPQFRTGDRVVIDEGQTPEPGDYVAALMHESVVLFRRYRLRGPGFELVPENPDWDIVSSADGVRVIGVMVEHRRYRRR